MIVQLVICDRRTLDRWRERRPRGDAGTTLMELIVGMAIMVVFMGMFTGAMLLMSNTTNKVQVISDTSTQSTNVFMRLDRQVRYAAAISTPSYDSSSSTWHVEFLTPVITRSGSNAVSNTSQCTQLAVTPPAAGQTTGVLKQRAWTVGDSSAGAWTVLAGNITNYGSTTSTSPFPTTTGIATGASTSQQQLTVNLVMQPVAPATTNTVSRYTFTALNSSTSNTAPVCQQFTVGS